MLRIPVTAAAAQLVIDWVRPELRLSEALRKLRLEVPAAWRCWVRPGLAASTRGGRVQQRSKDGVLEQEAWLGFDGYHVVVRANDLHLEDYELQVYIDGGTVQMPLTGTPGSPHARFSRHNETQVEAKVVISPAVFLAALTGAKLSEFCLRTALVSGGANRPSRRETARR